MLLILEDFAVGYQMDEIASALKDTEEVDDYHEGGDEIADRFVLNVAIIAKAFEQNFAVSVISMEQIFSIENKSVSSNARINLSALEGPLKTWETKLVPFNHPILVEANSAYTDIF